MRLFATYFGNAINSRKATKPNARAKSAEPRVYVGSKSLETRRLLTSVFNVPNTSQASPADWTDKNSWSDKDVPGPGSQIVFNNAQVNDYVTKVGGEIGGLAIEKATVQGDVNNGVSFTQTSALTVTNKFLIDGGNLLTNGSITVGAPGLCPEQEGIGSRKQNDNSTLTFANGAFTTYGHFDIGTQPGQIFPAGAASVRLNSSIWVSPDVINIGVSKPPQNDVPGESRLFVDDNSVVHVGTEGININNGGFLEGSGAVIGDVNNNAGTIVPGQTAPPLKTAGEVAGVGTLRVLGGTVNMGATSTLTIYISGEGDPGVTYSQLDAETSGLFGGAGGVINLNNCTLKLNVAKSYVPVKGDSYIIVNATNEIDGSFDNQGSIEVKRISNPANLPLYWELTSPSVNGGKHNEIVLKVVELISGNIQGTSAGCG